MCYDFEHFQIKIKIFATCAWKEAATTLKKVDNSMKKGSDGYRKITTRVF